jgi:hypothetical protein
MTRCSTLWKVVVSLHMAAYLHLQVRLTARMGITPPPQSLHSFLCRLLGLSPVLDIQTPCNSFPESQGLDFHMTADKQRFLYESKAADGIRCWNGIEQHTSFLSTL